MSLTSTGTCAVVALAKRMAQPRCVRVRARMGRGGRFNRTSGKRVKSERSGSTEADPDRSHGLSSACAQSFTIRLPQRTSPPCRSRMYVPWAIAPNRTTTCLDPWALIGQHGNGPSLEITPAAGDDVSWPSPAFEHGPCGTCPIGIGSTPPSSHSRLDLFQASVQPRHRCSIIHRQGAKHAKGTPGSIGSAFICLLRVIGVLAFLHRDHRWIQ